MAAAPGAAGVTAVRRAGRRPAALITGASSGIGRALALRLARDGYAVGLVARRTSKLQEVARGVERVGGAASVFGADVADREAVRAAAASVRSDLGPIDLLVANAGVSHRDRPEALDGRETGRVMAINFMGAVHAVEAVLPEMLERDAGHLVAVASLAGFGGLPERASYGASKAAMINFFESLRVELGAGNVAVTVVSPGFVRTAMTGGDDSTRPFLVELEPAAERIARAIRKRSPSLVFPRPLAWPAVLGRALPRRVYDVVARRARFPVAAAEAPR